MVAIENYKRIRRSRRRILNSSGSRKAADEEEVESVKEEEDEEEELKNRWNIEYREWERQAKEKFAFCTFNCYQLCPFRSLLSLSSSLFLSNMCPSNFHHLFHRLLPVRKEWLLYSASTFLELLKQKHKMGNIKKSTPTRLLFQRDSFLPPVAWNLNQSEYLDREYSPVSSPPLSQRLAG